MKEKIKKIKISKSQIITIVLAVVFSVSMSFGTSYAATTIFSSNNVGFDNTGTKIQATTVQGAIDELYDAATDYSSMNTRVNGVEETIGDGTLTTTSETLTGGINELNEKIHKNIQRGTREYTVTQGGWSSRATINVSLSQAMPDANYYASAHVTNAYADFPNITFYVFNKTTTSFDVVIINNMTGSTQVTGSFEWIAIHTS